MSSAKANVLVIGAGVSGLALARNLNMLLPQISITIIEKSRGVGGRMSHRRVEVGGGGGGERAAQTAKTSAFSFDHGAQSFTARSPEFRQVVKEHTDTHAVRRWAPRLMSLRSPATATATAPTSAAATTAATATTSSAQIPEASSWIEPHYCGTEGMSSLAKDMARVLLQGGSGADVTGDSKAPVSIVRQREVSHLVKQIQAGMEPKWQAFDAQLEPIGTFDWVVSSAPPAQTRTIFSKSQGLNLSPAQNDLLKRGEHSPSFSLMLGLSAEAFNDSGTDDRLPFDAAAVFSPESPISWISCGPGPGPDSSSSSGGVTPGAHSGPISLLVQSSAEWSKKHLEVNGAEVQQLLLSELEKVLSYNFDMVAVKRESASTNTPPQRIPLSMRVLSAVQTVQLHRWKYALTDMTDRLTAEGGAEAGPERGPVVWDFVLDETQQVGACGDWCLGARVEDAFLSGHRLGAQLAALIGRDKSRL